MSGLARGVFIFAYWLGLGLSMKVSADWVSLCPPEVAYKADYRVEGPYGPIASLSVGAHANSAVGCITREIPFSQDEIEWITLIHGTKTEGIQNANTLILSGKVLDRSFVGDIEVGAASTPSRQPEVSLHSDLRSMIPIESFGTEERAVASRDGDILKLTCHAGHRPAGFILPINLRTALDAKRIRFDYQSSHTFSVGAIDPQNPQKDPLILGSLDAKESPASVEYPLEEVKRHDVNRFTLICPSIGEGHVALQRLSLEDDSKPRKSLRATWIWNANTWSHQNDSLWEQLKSLEIGKLFISIPLTGEAHEPENEIALANFLQEAHRRGIQVLAVDGDPGAVLLSERNLWVERIRALNRYNLRHRASQRLDGIQLDIEPYLNRGYAFNPPLWKKAYLNTLKALKEASSIPLEIVIPFWWLSETPPDSSFLAELAPLSREMTIMAYRTNPSEIKDLTESALRWAQVHRIPVRIALEAGSLRPEPMERYLKSSKGHLFHYPLQQTSLFIRTRDALADDDAQVFEPSGLSTSHVELTTFAGDPHQLLRQVAVSEATFNLNPLFSGVGLHEILDLQAGP